MLFNAKKYYMWSMQRVVNEKNGGQVSVQVVGVTVIH